MRSAVVLGVALALVAGPALGAPKRACNLVPDPTGDAGLEGTVPPGSPAYPTSLDIVSADIASDARQLTAVIRVVQLQAVDTGSPTGIGYSFHVTVNKQRFELTASRNPGSDPIFTMWGRLEHVGDENNGAASYGFIGLIGGVFDEDASEIRMTAPLKNFTPRVKRGARFDDLRLWSYYDAGFASDSESRRPFGRTRTSTDRAESKATYAAGAPSCVKVGS